MQLVSRDHVASVLLQVLMEGQTFLNKQGHEDQGASKTSPGQSCRKDLDGGKKLHFI